MIKKLTTFQDKLRRYGRMKIDQFRKRAIYLRKPYIIARHPLKWSRRHRPEAVQNLSTPTREIYNALTKSGFSDATAIVDQELLQAILQFTESRLQNFETKEAVETSKRKDFWQMLLTADDLQSSNPLIQHALCKNVTDVVTAYLGTVPYLSRLELVVSAPTTGDWKVSQLWHRDHNDSRMVKLFTYLSDVIEEKNGPFTYLPASAARAPAPMFPVHKSDDQLSKYTDLKQKQVVLGDKGTSFFIDTHRCFHCGSRITDGSNRIAYIATFTTAAPFYNYDNNIVVEKSMSAEQVQILRV